MKKIKHLIFNKGKYVFWEYYLKDLNRGWQNPYGYSFDRFHEKDYKVLDKTFKKMEDKEKFFDLHETQKRLQNNHLLYVAKNKEDIIGFVWVVKNYFDVTFFNGTIYLNDDEGLLLNANIMKEYRGKGIYNRLKAYAFDDLKKEGLKRTIGFYWHRNIPAIRMNERFGCQIIGEVKCINFLTLIFRYPTFYTNKIVFHDGPLKYWKSLYRKARNTFQNNP